MKRTKIKRFRKIGIVILITAVLMSLLAILAYAEEENEPTHTSCVEEHFTWVEEEGVAPDDKEFRFPHNVRGSCSYVAMSLMLSYYDAYWDDRFVLDSYDGELRNYETRGIINSSGEITSDFHLTLENDSLEDAYDVLGPDPSFLDEREAYINFIDEHKDEFFHLYLISLAQDRGYHPFEIYYALINIEMVGILEYYLYNVCHFTEDQVTVHLMTEATATQEEMYAKAQEQIESGFPFMYTGLMVDPIKNEEDNIDQRVGAHALLGYKFTNNEAKDDIVLSYCWNDDDGIGTTTFYTNEFKYYSGIIWLEINEEALPHTCSASYQNSEDENEVYCVCEIYSGHPNHVCEIPGNEKYPCTASQMPVNCLCGQEVVGHHNYDYNEFEYSSDFHWHECACGDESMSQAHELESVYDEVAKVHYYTCYCGYITERHTLTCQDAGGGYHLGTCECGYSKLLPHNLIRKNVKYSICIDCGYTVYHNGGLVPLPGVLKKEDEETE